MKLNLRTRTKAFFVTVQRWCAHLASWMTLMVAAYFSLATSPAPTCRYVASLDGTIDFQAGETVRLVEFAADGWVLEVTLSPAAHVRTSAGLRFEEGQFDGGADAFEFAPCPFETSGEVMGLGGASAGPDPATPGEGQCMLRFQLEEPSQVIELEIERPETATRLEVEARAVVGGDCDDNAVVAPHAVRVLGGLD